MVNLHKFEDDGLDFYDLNNMQKLPHWISHHDNQVLKKIAIAQKYPTSKSDLYKNNYFLAKRKSCVIIWLVRTF